MANLFSPEVSLGLEAINDRTRSPATRYPITDASYPQLFRKDSRVELVGAKGKRPVPKYVAFRLVTEDYQAIDILVSAGESPK